MIEFILIIVNNYYDSSCEVIHSEHDLIVVLKHWTGLQWCLFAMPKINNTLCLHERGFVAILLHCHCSSSIHKFIMFLIENSMLSKI